MNRRKFDAIQTEYISMRDQIIYLMNVKDQLSITMYTLSITTLGFVFQLKNYNLIFIEFFILIIFQSYINSKSLSLAKTMAYIKVNIESKIKEINWEIKRCEIDCKYQEKYKFTFNSRKVLRIISRHGSFILGIVSLFIYLYAIVDCNNYVITLEMYDAIKIIICFACVTIIAILNIQSSRFYDTYSRYKNILLELNSEEKCKKILPKDDNYGGNRWKNI